MLKFGLTLARTPQGPGGQIKERSEQTLGSVKVFIFQEASLFQMAPLLMPPNIPHGFNAVGRTSNPNSRSRVVKRTRRESVSLQTGGRSRNTGQCVTFSSSFRMALLRKKRARFLQISSSTGTKSVHF